MYFIYTQSKNLNFLYFFIINKTGKNNFSQYSPTQRINTSITNRKRVLRKLFDLFLDAKRSPTSSRGIKMQTRQARRRDGKGEKASLDVSLSNLSSLWGFRPSTFHVNAKQTQSPQFREALKPGRARAPSAWFDPDDKRLRNGRRHGNRCMGGIECVYYTRE